MQSSIRHICCQHTYQNIIDQKVKLKSLPQRSKETTVSDKRQRDEPVAAHADIEISEILQSTQVVNRVVGLVDAASQLEGLHPKKKQIDERNGSRAKDY